MFDNLTFSKVLKVFSIKNWKVYYKKKTLFSIFL